MHLTARKFVLLLLALALISIGMVGGFNLLVDWRGGYPALHLDAFEPLRYLDHDRVAKAEMARLGDWQTVILGSSRAKAGLPARHPFLATNPTCNLSVDAARIGELAAMFEYARRHNRLEHVLLCLDFYMFSQGPQWVLDFPESRFNPNVNLFQYHCKALFSEGALKQNRETVKRWLKKYQPSPQNRNGFFETSLPPGDSQRAVFDRTLRLMGEGYSTQVWDETTLECLRRIVRGCREDGIDLQIAILPVHALDLELLYGMGRWSEFESWKRSMLKVLAEEGVEEKFGLWDFTGYAGPAGEPVPPPGDTTTRMTYYFENSHLTPVLGASVLDAIYGNPGAGFGAPLTPQSIERHLAAIRAERAAYAQTHAAEVAWVQSILDQVARPRKSARATG